MQEAFRLLKDSYRAVFVRRDLEGGSTEEVANALGISPANVRQRLSRARRKLRRQLKRFSQGLRKNVAQVVLQKDSCGRTEPAASGESMTA
jgi:DNA-directed RNA polymerase specialized sigma24 family protein